MAIKFLGRVTDVSSDHPAVQALDAAIADPAVESRRICWEEWLCGDPARLSPAARNLRTLMHNSKAFRAEVFRSHPDPEARYQELIAQWEGNFGTDDS